MENINHDEVINGANPTFIWCQLIDYFARTAKYMRHIYRDRNQANKPITWVDLDNVNEKIRKDLDVIYAGTTNVSDSAPITNENKTRNDMKRTIRLTESDLNRIVRSALNEVLDGMDDTEKAYWLMQQRQQRPNTKAKTPVDYRGQFAQQFNSEVYGNPNGGTIDANGRALGSAKMNTFGGFSGRQTTGWDINPNGTNFDYRQGENSENGEFYDINKGGVKMNPSQVNLHPTVNNFINKGRTRYNQIQQKYNQHRQSQQPKQPQG